MLDRTRTRTRARARAAVAGALAAMVIAGLAAGTPAAGPLAAAAPSVAPVAALVWKALQPGVDYAVSGWGDQRGAGDDRLHIVRIAPGQAALRAVMASAGDGQARTAGAWCRERDLAVAINLGMYRDDHRTNVGHAHDPQHVNNPRWVPSYKSALAFGPTGPHLPPAILVDLDAPESRPRLARYGTVIQNLRLIRAPGRGVWTQQPRRWSEAAVAIDGAGHVLFVFSRAPHSMREVNEKLLALPLGIAAAMHVEGGPEASLSIHAGGVDLDLNGSYETGFNENDDERAQWPVPNVLAVLRAR